MSIFVDRPAGHARFGRIFPPDPDWLSRQAEEAVLEPELAIVDAHHHLWSVPNHRYLIEEFSQDLACGHNIEATVLVEASAMYRAGGPVPMRPVGEVEFAAGMAAMSASGQYGRTRVAEGIVAHADLRLGSAVEPVLHAQIAAAGGRLRGIRYGTAWDASPEVGNSHSNPVPRLLGDASFRAGLARLQAMNLSFDALVHHPQLPEVADLAGALPGLRIVLGHLGTPLGYGPYAGRRDEVFATWKAGLAQVARHANVCVKLGGMVIRVAAFDYVALSRPPDSEALAALWRPYIETCIELFGPDRCMFESNFPVDKLGTGYRTLWNAYKRIASGASTAEKEALFSGTASRVYRLASGCANAL